MKNIAVVLPTIRPETIPAFLKAWQPLFDKHKVEFILVVDGADQHIIYKGERVDLKSDLVGSFCAGSRQLGFLFIAQNLPDVKYIITLDDDETPIGDPIQAHINQLNRKVPISWITTAEDGVYMRGFPYGVRTEAQVMLSHGVWEGVPDYDAPTQLLVDPKFQPNYYRGVIPKGIFFPMCGMNLAFRREVLPYVYFAPVGQYKGAERFDDILAGILLVPKFAELNYGIVSGYARVLHNRASNVFTSLEKEAVGIRHNEEFWKDPEHYEGDPFFDELRRKTALWYNLVNETDKDKKPHSAS